MPHYRKLWTKITTSEDVNAMPDDTTRLAWALLPVALDREGRGIYNGAWLRSKLFPLREDIENAQARAMLDWWRDHGMIAAYEVDGRLYFYLPTWSTYQGDCSREALSEIPAPPPEEVVSSSRPALDLVLRRFGEQAQAQAQAQTSEQAQAEAHAQPHVAGAAADEVLSELAAIGLTGKRAQECAAFPERTRRWLAVVRDDTDHRIKRPSGFVYAMVTTGADPPPEKTSASDWQLYFARQYS